MYGTRGVLSFSGEMLRGMSKGKTSLSKRGRCQDGWVKTCQALVRLLEMGNELTMMQWEANAAHIHTVIPTLNASSPSYAVITWKPVLCTGSSLSNSQSEFCSSTSPDDYQVGYQWNAILDFKLTNHIWQNCPGGGGCQM